MLSTVAQNMFDKKMQKSLTTESHILGDKSHET